MSVEAKSNLVKPGKLRSFSPFESLPADALIVAASHTTLHRYQDGERIIQRGGEDEDDYFLIDGRVALSDMYGNTTLIDSGSASARHAIAPVRPSLYDVEVIGIALCARILKSSVNALRCQGVNDRDDTVDEIALDITHTREFLMEFKQALKANRVSLPSVPELALLIRKAVQSKNTTSAKLAAVVNVDPAIAAKLLKVANSPLCRGNTSIEKLADAITRIGQHTVNELVICFTLKDLYRSPSAALQQSLKKLNFESVSVAALSSEIAARCKGMDAEQAVVAGLLFNIGALPIYDHIAANPIYIRKPEMVDRCVERMGPEVGSLVATKWELSAKLVEVISHCHDWSYDAGGEVRVVDAVIGARYHYELSHGHIMDLPKAEEIPALQRLFKGEFDPQTSIEILNASKVRLDALQNVLS